MKVSELLGGKTPITVRDNDTLALALEVMVWGGVRHLPVMRDDNLVGVLSERDVLRRYGEAGKQAGGSQRVGDVMKSPPLTASIEDEITKAVRLITETGVGCLPVVDGRKLVGVVTRHDFLRQQLDVDERLPEQPWTQLAVDDVMSVEPITAAAGDDLFSAIERMETRGVRHLPVIDAELRVVGMLSDRDVRSSISHPLRAFGGRDPQVPIRSLRVEDAMSRRPLTLPSGSHLSRAIGLFARHKVGAIPIVDDQNHIIGILSYVDLLRTVQP